MACPLSKAGLSGLASPATFAGARYAVLCLLVMSATISSSALSFTWLGHSTNPCFKTLRIPCGVWSGTRIRWLSASFWRPYFIGLRHCTRFRPHKPCWLSGRSESLSLSPCCRIFVKDENALNARGVRCKSAAGDKINQKQMQLEHGLHELQVRCTCLTHAAPSRFRVSSPGLCHSCHALCIANGNAFDLLSHRILTVAFCCAGLVASRLKKGKRTSMSYF